MATFTKLCTRCGLSYPTSQYDYISDPYLGNDGNWNHCGLYFPAVTIPYGAVITSAKVTFTAMDNKTADTVRIKISYQDADNPAIFFAGETYAQFEARARSADKLDWDFTTDWVSGSTYDSADITAVIQALVNEATWTNGDGVVLFFDDDSSSANALRTAYQTTDASKAPLLTIEYSIARLLRAIEKY